MIEKDIDIAVIGAGPAGMAAAISAREKGVKDIILLERNPFLGGILIQCIHDGFGLHLFDQNLTGPEYAEELIQHLIKAKVPFLTEAMVIDINAQKEIRVVSRQGLLKLKAKAIVLAMGCRERTRGALEIPGTRPAGIFTAGVAQSLVNLQNLKIGKEVVILGSGDVGLIMARRLKIEGLKVLRVIEKLPYCSGLVRNRVQCLRDYDIPLHLSSTVIDIHGKDRLEALTAAQLNEKGEILYDTAEVIPCDTLLLSVGLIPENELSRKAEVRLDWRTLGAEVDDYVETNTPGIFSCGNVLHIHDVADYASQEGFLAGERAACRVRENQGKVLRFPVNASKEIKYVVPQLIREDCRETELKFRVTEPFENIRIIVKNGGETLFRKKFLKIMPSEMNMVKISSDKPLDKVYVELEKTEIA
ncbi:FAD-dependent oxidoreductase [bacterium]|nr:FAD-dependent oxidoreductase [bacterium]